MLDYIFGYEAWLLEDPQRLTDFRIAVFTIALILGMAAVIAYLWYENRKKDETIFELKSLIKTFNYRQ